MNRGASEECFLDAIPDALTLIHAVHTHDEQLLVRTYSSSHLPGLIVALAALVDTDRSLNDLLGWADRPTVPAALCDPRDWGSSHHSTALHGTRGRYQAGCRGAGCKTAENTHQRERRRQRNLAQPAG
ncbi:MAG: hypothetical protein M3519_06210 [Actinomycetota bacterium]|nr:hypothetical protein [Actinomycetota bacterium]